MSRDTTWRDAQRRDRAALEKFTCTVPTPKASKGRPRPHPRPWELEVQTWIRQRKPPGPKTDLYRVGVDDEDTIVTVSITGLLNDPDDGLTFKLLVLAIAESVRGHGGAVADGCMVDALAQMKARAIRRGASEFLVIGMVDPRNAPSRTLCERNDFILLGQEGEYEVWSRFVAVTEGEIHA